MRALAFLAAVTLLVATPMGVSVASYTDDVGDTRVYLRHPSPSDQVLPPQHRYCTAPAVDLVSASAQEEAGFMVARLRVLDPEAPLDCIVESFETPGESEVMYIRLAEASPFLWLRLDTWRSDAERNAEARLWFRDGATRVLGQAEFEADGTGGFTFRVPLAGVAGDLFPRAYDITGQATSFQAHASASYPVELGARYEASDEINIEVPIHWQI